MNDFIFWSVAASSTADSYEVFRFWESGWDWTQGSDW